MFRYPEVFTIRNGLRQTLKENFIRRKENKFTSYIKWKDFYFTDFVNMYNIIANVYNARYEHETDWESDELFESFCIFIFNKSSKYIYVQSKDSDDL